MITAVSLNPCIDKTIKVQRFTYGGMNRVVEQRTDGSGKGINVAVCLKHLGCEVTCIGLLQEEQNEAICQRLISEHVPMDFIFQSGRVRTNTKLQDLSTGFITEINESGTAVNETLLKQIEEKVEYYAGCSELMIFSGSLPPGTPVDFYRRLICAAQSKGCRCVLDAEGEKLSEGISAKPYLIKPNSFELQSIVGGNVKTIPEILEAVGTILSEGVEIVAVSLGGNGALIVEKEEAWFAPALGVKVQSATGAGDSMVAGLCKGITEGVSLQTMFRYGVAAATASVMTEGSQVTRREDYEMLLDVVDIQPVNG